MVKDSWQTACMWMKEKDITQKVLEDNNDIFADIVNVLLFDGKSEVEENELVNTTVYSQYKAEDGKVHEQERISMVKKEQLIHLVSFMKVVN